MCVCVWVSIPPCRPRLSLSLFLLYVYYHLCTCIWMCQSNGTECGQPFTKTLTTESLPTKWMRTRVPSKRNILFWFSWQRVQISIAHRETLSSTWGNSRQFFFRLPMSKYQSFTWYAGSAQNATKIAQARAHTHTHAQHIPSIPVQLHTLYKRPPHESGRVQFQIASDGRSQSQIGWFSWFSPLMSIRLWLWFQLRHRAATNTNRVRSRPRADRRTEQHSRPLNATTVQI